MRFQAMRWAGILGVLGMVWGLPAHGHDGAISTLPQPPVLAQRETAPAPPPATSQCRLTIRLVDEASGDLRAGVIHLRDAQGRTLRPAELLARTATFSASSLGEAAFTYMDRWLVLPGERSISVPRESVTIEAFSGIGTRQSTVTVDLTGKESQSLAIPLQALADPTIDMGTAGNVHLHLKGMDRHEAERYATEIALGDALDVVFLSYLERAEADKGYISNTFTAEDLERFQEKSGVLFGYGEEYRHNFPKEQGYGHVMFLDLPKLILPASFGQSIMKQGNDDGVLRTGIYEAHAQQATVLWCHNAYGHEDIPNWIAGLIHGQIIFDGGAQGDYETGFYRYLNVGLHVPVSMGTDWHYNDMAMTLVQDGGEGTTAAWLAALRAGHSYISNGPVIEFSVDGAPAGEILAGEKGGSVRVKARAHCRNDFRALELVANGVVVARVEAARHDDVYQATLEVKAPIHESTWLAVRAAPFAGSYDKPAEVAPGFNEYGKPLFAHTSPVYVLMDQKPVFIPEAAESLMAELRSSMVRIRHTGEYTNDSERDKVLAIYEEAQATLKDKLAR